MGEATAQQLNPKVDVSGFLDLANQGNWAEFDRLVILFSEDHDYLEWTQFGLKHQEVDARDLAISLLEHTSSPIFNDRTQVLNEIMNSDENLHLRRKAAIALFKHGGKDSKILTVLQDAYENDPELKDQAKGLLSVGWYLYP